ncbi:MAG: hypothetical protein WC379_03610 [Methanoregula sp.]|jgi:hypothetical protein
MEPKVSHVKIIFFLVIIAVLVSGCVIGDGERDHAMSHLTPTIAQLSPITPTAIPIPSTPAPPSLYWIKINPIGDKQAGDIFTINSTTNLSVGNEILVQISQADFHPGIQPIGEEFHGITGTVEVMQGRDEANTISFIVNSSELYSDPRKYVITESELHKDSTGEVQSDATGEARFNITPRKPVKE